MDKKRSKERITVNIDVKLSRGRVSYFGKIVDISENGMLIRTNESILCGESYNVHIITEKESNGKKYYTILDSEILGKPDTRPLLFTWKRISTNDGLLVYS